MKCFWKYSIAALFFLSFLLGNAEKARSQDVDYKAYTLFLYNFMKYVEWPSNDGDFIIGVVGDSPVKKELYELAKTKKAKGRKIVVINVANAGDALLCNMVYIPSNKSSELKSIMEKVKGKSILLVAEREGMAKKGAAFSFAIDDDDSLKFDINKTVLEMQGLKIANILMSLGEIVG